jgi:hypothetical protein
MLIDKIKKEDFFKKNPEKFCFYLNTYFICILIDLLNNIINE